MIIYVQSGKNDIVVVFPIWQYVDVYCLLFFYSSIIENYQIIFTVFRLIKKTKWSSVCSHIYLNHVRKKV